MNMATAPRPDVSVVYHTAELLRRPATEINPMAEKSALLDLAGWMHDAPAEMLPKLVEVSMQLTGGLSAGISLLENGEEEQIFRWHHVRGLLSPFEGATTPRDFSPCGVTLDSDEPTLAVHPEEVYDWIPAGLSLPEVLLMPLHVGRSEPLGTLWIVGARVGHFNRSHARAIQELATFTGMALKMVVTENMLNDALERQETLTREMSHRLKNVFAIVDGMIRITAGTTRDKDEMAASLSGRLRALASAHSLVRRSFSDVQAVASGLEDLLRAIVAPHESGGAATPKFHFTGPEVLCGEQAVNGLALIFHEMATNAAKYGVLGMGGGRVEVAWQVTDGTLHLTWNEQGGPAITAPPTTSGFGSKLVEGTVRRQFRGTLDHDWHPNGLRLKITLPLARLET